MQFEVSQEQRTPTFRWSRFDVTSLCFFFITVNHDFNSGRFFVEFVAINYKITMTTLLDPMGMDTLSLLFVALMFPCLLVWIFEFHD